MHAKRPSCGSPGLFGPPANGVAFFGLAVLAALVSAAELPACPGDCDGDGRVVVAELVRAVAIGLGVEAPAACPAADADADGHVAVNDLVLAVSAAARGCPALTPTATPTATPAPIACGDGVAQEELHEECDDGNRSSGDGCSADCTLEPGGDVCAGVPADVGDRLEAVLVTSAVQRPVHVAAAPRDIGRLFIVEQCGRVRVVRWGQLLAEPFLDIRDRVSCGDERGLLSLAFHPQYRTNGWFYVAYYNTQDESIVSRFRVSAGDPDRAEPDSEQVLLRLPQPWVAHNGGQLAFGPRDGYLYVSFGDGGRGLSVQNNSQDPGSWFGSILRIDVDGGDPYAIPAGNPFVDLPGALPEIFVFGLRNPWRFDLDPLTGDLYIGDVGEGRWEEVDWLPGGTAGANYGWCCYEAHERVDACFRREQTCPEPDTLAFPLLAYAHPGIETTSTHPRGCSVTGGIVYRGCALPQLRGTYLYGDFCTGFVAGIQQEGGVVSTWTDFTADLFERLPDLWRAGDGGLIALSSFGRDARGEAYVASLEGSVWKIVPER